MNKKLSIKKVFESIFSPALPSPSNKHHTSSRGAFGSNGGYRPVKLSAKAVSLEKEQKDDGLENFEEQEESDLSISAVVESIVDDNKKGAMIALMVPSDVSSKMLKCVESLSGYALDPRDVHITLGMFKDTPDKNKALSTISSCLKKCGPLNLSCNFSRIRCFEKNPKTQKTVIYAVPEFSNISDLNRLHSYLFSEFSTTDMPINNGDFGFKPHATLKYVDSDNFQIPQMPSFSVNFGSVVLAIGSNYFEVPIK